MKKRLSLWDILAWIALIIIIIWVVLKITGLISSPLWLEYIPIYSAVYIAGWQIHKLQAVSEDVKDLKNFKNQTIKEIHEVRLNCAKNHSK